ncbi:hypothetical protein KCMC57_up40130 [Kitasatospora sp. CMC57]|uniref:NodB homology domain-containing protein n=1 Tax=Kitasatospora sp. CMC57 TaxID=3231513 RepID=A0AB33K1N4_9ACTN
MSEQDTTARVLGGASGEDRRGRLDRLLRRSPFQPFFRARAAHRLSVLAYHGVDDRPAFTAQMERLVAGATPVSLATVERAVTEGRPLPPRSVLVTFDDGDRTVLTRGLPVLTRLGVPAAAFVVAELVDGDQPFWWREALELAELGGVARALAGVPAASVVRRLKLLPDVERRAAIEELRATAARPAARQQQLSALELLELAAAGVAIGSHTLGHPCLDRCEPAVVRTEIEQAHRMLTGWLGVRPTAFAYPNGNFDAGADAVLRGLGYRLGFLFDHRQDALLPPHPLRISRLRVNSDTSRDRFDTILSGLHPAVHRLRGGC